MQVRSRSEIASLVEAYALLGLTGPADAEALGAAFRRAAKAARPDAPGGDAARFRRVIAAFRLIQAQGAPRPALAAPPRRPAPKPVVVIDPLRAVSGGMVDVRLDRRSLRLTVPAGLRTGEHIRLKQGGADGSDIYLPVLIRASDGLICMGDDLYMTFPASPRVLRDGGRIDIDTHAGIQSAWVARGLTDPIRLRLKNLGLPARGSRPQGHLFVTLVEAEDVPSAAEDLLARFTRVWTPERMAA
ncbi:MAG: J domain-containing protein [Brevundimonas sp.]|nr:MAG: J domain-containing protein [Brevundimonas sp.]